MGKLEELEEPVANRVILVVVGKDIILMVTEAVAVLADMVAMVAPEAAVVVVCAGAYIVICATHHQTPRPARSKSVQVVMEA